MSRLCIIAAGGESQRTGLGKYTSKAVLPFQGKTLLAHQMDLARRSRCDRVVVVCQAKHAKKIAFTILDAISPAEAEQGFVAIIVSDKPTGWVGEVERCGVYIEPNDEVLLISCDNIHVLDSVEWLGPDRQALFTYTNWNREGSPTSGLVLTRSKDTWWHIASGQGFQGEFFSGYVVVRGHVLLSIFDDVEVVDGKKEMVSFLKCLVDKHGTCEAIPYPGEYIDIADVSALAEWEETMHRREPVVKAERIGAAILLHENGRVLLAKRSDGLGWVPPGGRVDAGESYEQAAIRETREEVGVGVKESELRLLGVYTTRGKTGAPAATVVFHVSCGAVRASLARPMPPEMVAVKWVNREEALQMKIPFNLDKAVRDHYDGKELDSR